MITRYVNRQSTAGGDGTTNATSGANRAWADMDEAEAGIDTLAGATGLTDDVTCWCDQGSATPTVDDSRPFFDGILFNGYTVYMKGNETSGYGKNTNTDYDTAYYHMEWDSSVIEIKGDAELVFSGLQVKTTRDGTAARACFESRDLDVGETQNVEIEYCHITMSGQGSNYNGHGIWFFDSDGTKNYKMHDCVFNEFYRSTSGVGSGIHCNQGASMKVYNNVFIGCDDQIYVASGTTITAKNNIFQDRNQEDIDDDGGTVTFAYNLTDQSTLPGSNNVTNASLTFVDKANDDFHLASGDTDAMNAGIGPSSDSDVPTSDWDGDTRSGTTCDIGLDEYVAADVFVGDHATGRGVNRGVMVGVG